MKKYLVLIVVIAGLAVAMGDLHAGLTKKDVTADSGVEVKNDDNTSLSGKVVETMESGGYTYVSIEKNGNKTWVAVPRMDVKVGQDISFNPGMVMRDFTSKTLNRTFDEIVFSSGVAGSDRGGGHGFSGSGRKTASAKDEVKEIKVDKAEGPDAYTVGELYGKKADLDNKSVTVKGQVVKVSTAIMGKNWIHIQDGSGSESERTNDLLVTSQDLPSVGDVVTVKGTLYKDEDFGSGYKYAVIVEEASITK